MTARASARGKQRNAMTLATGRAARSITRATKGETGRCWTTCCSASRTTPSRISSMLRSLAVLPKRSLSSTRNVRSAYGELQTRTCRFASALGDLGLRPEERLAFLLYDSVDFPVAFWGALRAGIVALPLNTLLTAEQYAYILADSRASAIVVAAPLAKTLIPILDRLPRLRTVILVGADADERAAFAARDVCDFGDLVARRSRRSCSRRRHCRTKSRSGCTRPARPANPRASSTSTPR